MTKPFNSSHEKKLKAIHIKGVERIIGDYGHFISEIKDVWKIVVEKLQKRVLDDEEIEDLFSDIGVTKRIRKEVKSEITDNNLWAIFISLVKKTSKKYYKNEINKMEKLNKISKICYRFALAEAI